MEPFVLATQARDRRAHLPASAGRCTVLTPWWPAWACGQPRAGGSAAAGASGEQRSSLCRRAPRRRWGRLPSWSKPVTAWRLRKRPSMRQR